MPTVETVLGPIGADSVRFTLSHGHAFVAMGEDNHHYPWLFDWERTPAKAVRELHEAKAGGVDTIIDLTTPDLGVTLCSSATSPVPPGINNRRRRETS